MSLSNKVVIGLRTDGQKGLFASAEVLPDEVLLHYDGPQVGHPTRYSIQIGEDQHIEGTPESNAFLNHSCAPNAYVHWASLTLRACRVIKAEEEITCDYNTTDWELHSPFHCTCESSECQGEIRGFRLLPPREQHRRKHLIPNFMKRRLGQ